MTTDRPICRAAFYTGNFHLRDGIGRSIRDKVGALRSGADGRTWQVTVFCQSSNIDDPAVRVCSTLAQVIRNPAFREADVHIFEYGWFYELMDAMLFIPPQAKTLAHFQGVTAPEFITDKAGYFASWKQQFNLHKADVVLCSSHHSRNELTTFGIEAGKLRLLPLPVTVLPRNTPIKAPNGPVNLLQVGRLMPSKGTLDLVQALGMLPDGLRNRVHLKIVGSRSAGDQDYLSQVDAVIAEHNLQSVVEFAGTVADDDDLSDIYAAADALVTPSYHEGYCLPVVEAYAHGCHVIAYDNSNLPYVTAGLGRIVPTGDIAALSAAIGAFAGALARPGRADGSAVIATESGPVPWSQAQEKVREHAGGLVRAKFDQTFFGFIDEALSLPARSAINRLDPVLFFEDRKSFVIRPQALSLKEPYGTAGLELLQDGRIEYDRSRFAGIAEPLLFFGPYIDVPPGRWRLRLDAEILGEFTLKLTCNFGAPITEAVVSNDQLSVEFDIAESGDKFETLLFVPPDAGSLILRAIILDRI